MKIAVISPNPHHLAALGPPLQSLGHEVLLLEGGKSRMPEVAGREQPQLMVVDGLCCDAAELAHIEEATALQPQLAVVLLCSTHSQDFLIEAMRAGVREVLPSPPPLAALEAAVRRVQARLGGRSQAKVLAFMPCKGGSGATFLATNIAWQLAQSASVLVVDLNLQFGDALSFVHDGRPAATIADVVRDIQRLDASLLSASAVKVAPGYSLLAAPEDLAQAMEVTPAQVDALLAQAAAQFEFVVLDMGRSLDPVTVRALDRATRIHVVMQSALPDLRHAGRLVATFRSLGYAADKLEVIVNRHEKSSEIGLDQVQRALPGVQVRTVANAWREVHSAINHGEALGCDGRSSGVARQLAEFARVLSPRTGLQPGLLGRLLRRA
jgi:pilus assembly protein CpaE